LSDVILVLLSFLASSLSSQSAATSRAYALRYRDPFNQHSDLVRLSFANAIAGCSSTFVVNGSPTKTAMVDTVALGSSVSNQAAEFSS